MVYLLTDGLSLTLMGTPACRCSSVTFRPILGDRIGGNRLDVLATGLLIAGMTHERNSTQAENKGARRLAVRFAHAPCVKLTLQTVTSITPASENVRFLRLRKPGTLVQIAA